MEKKNLLTYKPSGKIGFMTFPLFAVMLGLGVVLSIIYRIGMNLLPWIVLNLFLTLALGAALGYLAKFAIRFGKSRNVGLSIALTGIVALGVVLLTHVVKVLFSLAVDHTLTEAFSLLGSQFFYGIAAFAERGFSIARANVHITGFWVYLIWAIELLLVVGIAILLSYEQSESPFCESCGQWCKEEHKVFSGIQLTDASSLVDKGDIDAIFNLPNVGEAEQEEVTMTCHYCARCANTAFLSIKGTLYEGHDSDGEPKKNERALLEHAVMTVAQKEKCLSRIKETTSV